MRDENHSLGITRKAVEIFPVQLAKEKRELLSKYDFGRTIDDANRLSPLAIPCQRFPLHHLGGTAENGAGLRRMKKHHPNGAAAALVFWDGRFC